MAPGEAESDFDLQAELALFLKAETDIFYFSVKVSYCLACRWSQEKNQANPKLINLWKNNVG